MIVLDTQWYVYSTWDYIDRNNIKTNVGFTSVLNVLRSLPLNLPSFLSTDWPSPLIAAALNWHWPCLCKRWPLFANDCTWLTQPPRGDSERGCAQEFHVWHWVPATSFVGRLPRCEWLPCQPLGGVTDVGQCLSLSPWQWVSPIIDHSQNSLSHCLWSERTMLVKQDTN